MSIINTTSSEFKKLIIHEDDDFIVINKPPHVSTLEDRSSPLNILKWARTYWSEAKVCHRLDKTTSGLLVIAKNDETYKYFSQLLEHREVTKIYHAIVEGCQQFEEIELNKPIYSSSNRSKIDFKKGKPSMTLASTIEIYKQHSLIACMPFTGRMHQIRVHLADFGLPIVGDSTYGGKQLFLSSIKKKYKISKNAEEKPLLSRLALHAAGIHFIDRKGQIMKLKAPYPKDLGATILQLEKNTH